MSEGAKPRPVGRRGRKPRAVCRIAACPNCLKWNKVPATVLRYLCGHCGKPVDGTTRADHAR